MKKKGFLMALLLCFSICFAGCTLEEMVSEDNSEDIDWEKDNTDVQFDESSGLGKERRLGEPMRVDGVLELTLNQGNFYETIYPSNASQPSNYLGNDAIRAGRDNRNKRVNRWRVRV